ncbi:putative disease resistance protein RGA3 [Coffea arabica]|uniref:Disease resistance protein RGA3 n=1 Tax=Coffea arabica TaxID=13443 RepID=A0A6P6SJ23_COFAR|nr:putative disease resistance protein RGA3 [Coffea arabica]XP_027065533.1 putative disease resistance protein RGA3 [Coffea arabica]
MEAAFQAGIAQASLQVLLERITDFAVKETSLILGVDDEIRRLQRTLQRIRAILDIVGNNQQSLLKHSSTEAWKMWAADLEKHSYSAEDLLDEILLDLLQVGADHLNEANESYQVRNMLLSSFKLSMPHEIGKIRKELEDIATEMDSLVLTKMSELGSYKLPAKSCLTSNFFAKSTSSLVDEGFVVGREKDKDEIVKMLLTANANRSNVSVIPLVGMGGIGKTTLAQIVYNDNRVVKNFDLRVWISVSVNFDVIGITKSIIESLTGKKCKLSDLDPIQCKLQSLLSGRKFLLVLDDYWTEKYGDWDSLTCPFRVGLRGSKVVVTTRSSVVASILGTFPAYHLKVLNDKDCWELMKQRAFSNKDPEENMNMEEMGRKIAKKCRGLPLAAQSLGGMLHFQFDEEEWECILNSELWDLPQEKNDIFSSLLISYHFLPSHLKKCFAYCSIFPRNHEFERDKLVLLWMAEGFIQPRGGKRLEDVGSDYFNELIWRSFLQFSHVNLYNQSMYKMHDLVHGMARLISANTCFCLAEDISYWHPALANARHMSLGHANLQQIVSKPSTWCKNLRTLLLIPRNSKSTVQLSYELFLKLRFLRALDLCCMDIYEIPDSIEYLKHLRFLNLSENHIQNLPESITNILGLQTLVLKNCFEFLELPANLKKLTNLRHLDLDIKHQLNYMPSDLGNLVNLQTMNAFIVGKGKGCGIGQLGNMRFLRGSICITNLENVLSVMEANEANLCMKPFLESLQLEWNYSGDRIDQQEVLAGLQPHPNLKELAITNYGGFMFPSWLGDPLLKLRTIHIRSCQYCSVLPSLGQLPLLKHLCIENLSSLASIDDHFCGFGPTKGFPSLELLIFQNMPNLMEWKGLDGQDMPLLRELTFINCPRLTSLPSLHNLSFLHNLNISHCPKLQALPEQGLPVSLQILIILESAIIKERCRVEEGEDWYKIKRIPKIEIDYVQIPMVA